MCPIVTQVTQNIFPQHNFSSTKFQSLIFALN